MKQTDPVQIEKSQEIMAELSEIRGGGLLPFHRKLANDPQAAQRLQEPFCVLQPRR